VHLGHLTWDGAEPPTEPVLRARLAADGFGAFLWQDAPGAHYQSHAHENDETLWVLTGEIVFEVAGCSYRLGPGDRLQLPAGTRHAATVGANGATYLIGERRRE
jgi:quercetin dioxygenase-like cupin family protein